MSGRDDKAALRLWLRLLACSTAVEREVGRRLREEFGSTLPRFDLLSALDRAGEAGLTMGEAAERLRVTNGNVTGVARRLEAEGLIERRAGPDRRVQRLRLTAGGRARFAAMAAAHAGWIGGLFTGLDGGEIEQLGGGLERARSSIRSALREEATHEGA
ncbi:MarR family winged helix-turn-helix transcriptional regulator [Brevundimonas sp.]|uniref:MarR family winged helix-turn-helix transcriptional regulator n=1 Tax=Brevundimonas sp. TaxID=1871086 RepID=UPI0035B1A954